MAANQEFTFDALLNINDYNYDCNLDNHGKIKFIILNSIFYAKGLFIFRGAL